MFKRFKKPSPADLARFSPLAIKRLKKSGWFSGRVFKYERHLDELMPIGNVFPVAAAIWREFGGLLIKPASSGLMKTCLEVHSEDGVRFTSNDLLAIDLNYGQTQSRWHEIDGDFIQIGSLPEFNASVMAGEDGKVYMDGDNPVGTCCVQFKGIESLIESVLHGEYAAGRVLWQRPNTNLTVETNGA